VLERSNLTWLRHAVATLRELRLSTIDVIRRGWLRLTLGMIGYLGMQFLLFWSCLEATSTNVSVSAMIAAFGLSRVLATTSVTPGGIGVTESGTAALLVALGAPGRQRARPYFCSGSSATSWNPDGWGRLARLGGRTTLAGHGASPARVRLGRQRCGVTCAGG
jgi:hypothetical protein